MDLKVEIVDAAHIPDSFTFTDIVKKNGLYEPVLSDDDYGLILVFNKHVVFIGENGLEELDKAAWKDVKFKLAKNKEVVIGY